MVFPKGSGLEGEWYLEVLGLGYLEGIPAGQAPSLASPRGLQSALTSLLPPHPALHTHPCLVLAIRSPLPLNFWILSPSGLILPPSQPYTQNLTHSWSPKTIHSFSKD